MTKHHYLQMLFAIIFSAICIAFAFTPNHQLTRADPNSTKNNVVVCPLNLTESLPCFCHVLPEGQSVQIICKNTQPKHVWTVLGGYSAPINKMAIRNCPNRTEIFHPVPDLKIRSLVISSCPISQFSPNAFDSLATSMEELWLLNNTLTSSSIPQLGRLLLLKALNLNMNEIVTFPDATLRGLKNLTQLRLRSNRICNLINPLQDQKNSLVLLDLSHNCLGAVPASALRGCLQLKHMSLANNQLTEIGSMQLMSLPELIELRLQGNRLQRIVPNGFMNVPKLQQLFLQENSLSFFDPGTLQAHKELQLVDLRANAFTTIPSFKDMAELTEVRLDHNRICAIETLAFSSNPKLTRISLAGNQISEIAKNSFDSLDQLEWLDLADNALTTIGPGRLEGMRQLHDLILRNNSIEELNRQSFASVPQLVGLDLSHNELKTLRAGTFGSLQRLRLLKLEHNQLETVEKGAFVGKVDTVLLDGNQLRCDSQLDWFIDWLVAQKVRTFVPSQPEIKCAGPGDKEGTRLKDLMMDRNNGSADEQQETNAGGLTRGGGADPMTAGAGQMLANLIPGIHQAQGAQVGTQLLNSLASKYRMPGLNFLAPNTMASQTQGGTGMESVIDQFSEPIVKFASGVQPSPADVNKLLQSLPSLMVNVPGFGNVDVSKLNPSLVEYVLKGGQIPGIPRETLTQIVKQYMQRLYVAAAQAQGIPTTDMPPLPPGTNASRVLRPIAELPHGLVQSVMEGNPLPHLSTEQTSVIREYYTQHAPVGQLQLGDGGGVEQMNNLTNLLSPKVIQMMQLLPRNYNLSKLPPDLVRQVMQGEMPDLTRLPVDLQQHIKDNFDRLIASLENTPDLSIEEILKKLPRFEQPPNLSTFSPYDINAVDSELVTDKKKSAEQARFWRTCAAVALGLAGAVTLGVLSAFCCCWPTNGGNYYPGRFHSGYWHRTGGASIRGLDSQSGEPGRGLPSVVREQSFRPSANSTLK